MEQVKRIPLTFEPWLKGEIQSGDMVAKQYLKNVMYVQKNGTMYLTQRPALDMVDNNIGTDGVGRGILVNIAADYFIVNGNDVFYTTGAYNTAIGTLAAGTHTKKVSIISIDDGTYDAVIVDPQNNDAHVLTTSAVTQITDADFPSTLTYGAVWLNEYLFVMDSDGVIYNSNNGDATAWTAGDSITTTKSAKGGKGIALHKDHIVAFREDTVDFFYDVGNPVGSPLARRGDLSYNVGCVDGATIATIGDMVVFLGRDSTGGINLYKIVNFQLSKIAPYDVIWHYGVSGSDPEGVFVGTLFSVFGKTLYSIFRAGFTNKAQIIDTDLGGIYYDWVSGTAISMSTIVGASGLGPGFVIFIDDDGDIAKFEPTYQQAPIYDTGIDGAGTPNTDVTVEIRTPVWDGGTNRYKNGTRLDLINQQEFDEESTTNVSISWSDSDYGETFNTARTIDLQDHEFLTRLGRFRRRQHKITTTAQDRLYLEALEMSFNVGQH